ncbi:MAG: hypothetical protein ACYTFZ_08845 [Planctomycetota bacterium]|jgi:hypothetical protein
MTRLPRAAVSVLALAALMGQAVTVLAQDEPPPLPEIAGAAEEDQRPPPLPEMGGPASEAEPGLPPLPEGSEPAQEPELPPLPELVGPEEPPAEPTEPALSERLDHQLERLPVPLHGFWEARAGPRVVEDPDQSGSFTLGETRLQLETDPSYGGAQFSLKADFLCDFVVREGRIEMREANVAFSPFDFMDVKAGRQILTWGTGDLLFLNDLFPKDYVSFFIGRDVEYLKAPSDALKLSFFSGLANLDVVYTPRFDPDTFVTGKRLSYYNPLVGGRTGEKVRIRTDEPNRWFRDDEVALRLYRAAGSYEVAAYGYRGFWKSPVGLNPTTGKFAFPRLDAYGASVRGPVARGIGNVEFSYYNSRDDSGGGNPFVPNSEWRFLLGYSQDLPQVASDFTVGVQYYLEHMQDYGSYKRALPAGMPKEDQNRHLLTLRLTKLLLNQDLRLDLFTFWGVTDDEVYLRPTFSYDITDRWRIDGGANIFFGDENHTQFAQFEHDTNVYVGLRYSF